MDKESCNWFRFAKLLIDIGSEVLRTYFTLEIQTSCLGRFSSLWLENVLNPTAINYASNLWTKLFLSLDHADQKLLKVSFLSWNVEDSTLLRQIHEMNRWRTDLQSKLNSYPDTHVTIMRSLESKLQSEIRNLTALYNILKDWTRRFFECVNKYQQGLQDKIKKYHDDFILSCRRKMRKLQSPSKQHIEHFVTDIQNDVQSIRHKSIQESEEYINLWMSEIHSILDSFKNEKHDIHYNYVLQDLLSCFINDLLNAHNSCKNDIQQIDRSWNDDLQMMFGKWQLQINGFAKLGWDFKHLIPLWCMDLRAHHSSADYQIRDFFHSQDAQTKLKALKEQEIFKDYNLSKLSLKHDFPDIRRFDISILILFLRNMCPVCPPDLGWFRETPESDLSVGADLMRLRSSRNDYIGHSEKASIPEDAFGELWTTVEELLCRLASHCSDCFLKKIRENIADLKICPLEPQPELVLKEELINWCKNAILVDISDMSLSGAMTEVTIDRFMEMYRSVQNTEQKVFQKNTDFVNLDAQGKASAAGISRHVMAERDDKEGPFSEPSGVVATQQSLATRLKNTATKLSSGNPQIYKLPLTFSEETTNKTAMIRKGRFGKRDHLLPTKTIMVVGATGAGKSTMINGMINYIVDVAWEDDFRFTIIEDEKGKIHLQDIAQTNWITFYEVNYQHGSRLDYNLNIIDTPGFGGTRGGIGQDKKIVDQIREFFTAPGDRGIDTIDAVCLIVQSALSRLTHFQKYIFDAILSVFGKDVKDNIFVLITFADGREAPVLAVLKEANVPFQQAFNFNNSALFECSNASDLVSQIFWKLGITSFDKFFNELLNVQQRSLQLTSQLLVIRKQLENTIEHLQSQINDGLHKVKTLKKEKEILEKHKRDIEDNRNFKYEAEQIRQRLVDTKPGQYVSNCFVCNFTCDLQCEYANDREKAKCKAMGKDGNCTICKGKCHWSKHKNNTFYYETYIDKVGGTYESMKKKYESAVTGEQKQASMIQAMESAFKSLGRSVMPMMKTVRDSVNKLEQGTLKPNPLNEVNYVKLLIGSEKREANMGWEARVKLLEEIKMKAELVQKISSKSTDWTDEEIERFFNSGLLTCC